MRSRGSDLSSCLGCIVILSGLTGKQCDQIKAIRIAYNARRPLGLLMRHLETMPRALVETGTARGREMAEQTEGAAT